MGLGADEASNPAQGGSSEEVSGHAQHQHDLPNEDMTDADDYGDDTGYISPEEYDDAWGHAPAPGRDDPDPDDNPDDDPDGDHNGPQNNNNLNTYNRFRNPQLWSNSEMRTLIKIWRPEFEEFCNFCRPATRTRGILSHESCIFLFLYRMTHGTSSVVLGALFRISPRTVMKVYHDVLFYLLMCDPHIPAHDDTMTDVELESLLLGVRNRQSPGIR